MKVADIYAEFGIKGDTAVVGRLANQMSSFGLSTLGAIGLLGILAETLKGVVFNSVAFSSAMTKTVAEYGLSAKALQEWQNVARASNVDVGVVAPSMSNLAKTLASFRQGTQNPDMIKAAAFFGFKDNILQKTPEEIFNDLRTKVPALIASHGRAYVSNTLSMLGIDPSMIQAFMLSKGKFNQDRRLSPIFSSSEISDYTKLSEEFRTASHTLFVSLSKSLIPAISGINTVFSGLNTFLNQFSMADIFKILLSPGIERSKLVDMLPNSQNHQSTTINQTNSFDIKTLEGDIKGIGNSIATEVTRQIKIAILQLNAPQRKAP